MACFYNMLKIDGSSEDGDLSRKVLLWQGELKWMTKHPALCFFPPIRLRTPFFFYPSRKVCGRPTRLVPRGRSCKEPFSGNPPWHLPSGAAAHCRTSTEPPEDVFPSSEPAGKNQLEELDKYKDTFLLCWVRLIGFDLWSPPGSHNLL